MPSAPLSRRVMLWVMNAVQHPDLELFVPLPHALLRVTLSSGRSFSPTWSRPDPSASVWRMSSFLLASATRSTQVRLRPSTAKPFVWGREEEVGVRASPGRPVDAERTSEPTSDALGYESCPTSRSALL